MLYPAISFLYLVGSYYTCDSAYYKHYSKKYSIYSENNRVFLTPRYQGSRDCCSAKDNPQHCGFCSLKGWGKDRLGNPRSDDGGQHFILVKIYRAIVRSMKKKMILKIQFALITSSRRKRPTPNTTVPVWAKK